MPAKRTIYRDIGPSNWGHHNADRLQDIYDRNRSRPPAIIPERGARPGKPVIIPERPDPRNVGDRGVQPIIERGPWYSKPAETMKPVGTKKPTPTGTGTKFRLPGTTKYPFPGGGPLNYFDLADRGYDWYKNRYEISLHPDMPPGTRMCMADPQNLPNYPNITHVGVRAGLVNANDCGLTLQAWPGAVSAFGPNSYGDFSEGAYTFVVLQQRGDQQVVYPAPAGARFRYAAVFQILRQPPTGIITHGKPYFRHIKYTPGSWLSPNPNRAPGPAPWPPPEAGMPGPGTDPGDVPPLGSLGPGRDPSPAPDLTVGTEPWVASGDGVSTPPNGRNPTLPGEKERKVVLRSAKVAKTIFNALDTVSEWAEVVDCIYDALPKKTRSRWEKKLGLRWVKVKTPYNPGGQWIQTRARKGLSVWETGGQYGLDGADWKSAAIYNNVKHIDVNQAINCIALNHLEDQFYGAMHKILPVQTGNAMAGGMQATAEFIDFVETSLGIKL